LLALIPPTALAFLEFGTTKALIVVIGFVVINGGMLNFIQLKLMGAGLNLSNLVVALSLLFWGWVRGPMGALVAVPLTMIVKDFIMDAYDQAYQSLSGEIWENYYSKTRKNEGGDVVPLPQVGEEVNHIHGQ